MTAPRLFGRYDKMSERTLSQIINDAADNFSDGVPFDQWLISHLAAAGYKILPREPTEEMCQSIRNNHEERWTSNAKIFRAMWDAAP